MNWKRIVLFGGIAAIGLAICCVGAVLLTPSSNNSETTASNTADQRVEEPPPPASQSEAVAPTETPLPTPTPLPTDTPTPLPPTATPAPIALTGSGDSVVEVNKWEGPAIAQIKGNATGNHFSVTALDASNETIDLLVNTTSSYEGERLIDFGNHFNKNPVARFEIKSSGPWEITLRSLSEARSVTAPSGEISGQGYEVIRLEGQPEIADIQGNEGGNFFAVSGLGDRNSLVVNTTDPYQGRVYFDADDLQLLEIQGNTSWRITLRPLAEARVLNAPGEITGRGDDVIRLTGEATTATITGNAAGRHFGVKGYDGGSFPDLMVNTVEPYQGTVIVKGGVNLIVIEVDDDWTFKVP